MATTTKKCPKWNYNKVIQQNYGYGWEDVSEYDADSKGNAKDKNLLKHDLKEYRMQHSRTRVVFRKEKNNRCK